MKKIMTPWHHLEELEKLDKKARGRSFTENEAEDFRVLTIGALNQLAGIVDQLRGDITLDKN